MNTRLTLLPAFIALALGVQAQTQQQLFNDNWEFSQNGTTQSVNLPHDWDIYSAPLPETGTTGTGGGWYPAGKAEYRKTFSTPKGDCVKLHFEGVYQKAEVFINGQKAGQHHYGYTPFTVDITPYLNAPVKKGQNEVVVKVDNSEQPNCRWYSGSGIYRHVWLQTMPSLHIAENGIFVTTPEVSAHQALVQVEVSVENESQTDRRATVSVGGKQLQIAVPAGKSETVTTTFTVDNPRLWSPDSPALSCLDVELKDGEKVIDNRTVSYGIRTISFDAKRGFLLNGKPTPINGACLHHDTGILGAMAFDDAEIRKVRQMKDAGFNLIRTSHNPSSRAFMDACDSIGMMVIDEAFDGWRSPKNKYDYSTAIDSCYREDIHAMVKRDRNHPCVISWSIGNEVIERTELMVVTTAKKLKKAVQECDATRPVTEALACWGQDWESFDPHCDVLDIVGYNYMLHKHATDHERCPERVMWQTESYPRSAFTNWTRVHDHSYIVGDIVWTGLDYLGESSIGRYYYEGERGGEHFSRGGQPEWHGAYCGDVDVTGWRKPISHYREMLWNEDVPLYMAVKEPDGYHGKIKETGWSVWPMWESWTWPGWEGRNVDVEIYTKQPKVSLYLNDQLIGTKEVSRKTEFKAVFKVPYKAGELRAVAGDEQVTLRTAGEPSHLRLTTDRTVITADGQSLAFVIVEVVDKDGIPVPEAAIPCEATVKGAGTLLAFASADMKDREPTVSPQVTTWKGRAMLVVRSTPKRGNISLSVKSTLPTATLKLRSK